MIGLLGIGLALVLGVMTRIAASAGGQAGPLVERRVPAGVQPFMDDRIDYALVLVAIALAGAGQTWGLGGAYDRLSLVRRSPLR
jgi:thiosulfate dehydrogenase [quinone] large subunit